MSVKQVLSDALGGVQGNAQPRGLHNFIQEIRHCSNAAEEQQRVDKELANIRNKFSSSSGLFSSSAGLSSYSRKKYVWKLVYMFMLGYEIDFGHMEMISLISSTKYSEKNVGYVAVSLLLRSGDTMMTLVINSIRNDLTSHSSPAQTLALATVANLGGNDLCEALLPDVERLLVMKSTDPAVRKKAALCFLRFFRESPESIVHGEWAEKMARLLENKNLGVVTSVMSLLMGLASKSPADYEELLPLVIHLLTRLVLHKACASEYLYYGTPTPWLHVKLLKFLQLYPLPADESQREKLDEALERIITKTEVSASVNKSNADHCILFEAVNVIIHHGQDGNEELRGKAMGLLGRFIAVKEPNIRYLGLEMMSRLARLEGSNETTKQHQATVLMSLKDADISIRRRALDLLFVMADETNGAEIVEELVTYLAASDAAIREEMVLKIAILAEKFTDHLNWYVDKMLEVIAVAGDFVASAVWHRIIQIVTNHKDLQAYAAERLFITLRSRRAHETAVNIGGYILGEFGYFIAEQESMSGQEQFHVLHGHFSEVGPAAKALLLSTYAKLANLYPECRDLVTPVFDRFSSSQNLELQQRACEYLNLPHTGIDVMEEVLKEMPAFPDDRESGPEARLRRRLEAEERGAEEGLRNNTNAGKGAEDGADAQSGAIVVRSSGAGEHDGEDVGRRRDAVVPDGELVDESDGQGSRELVVHEPQKAIVEVDDLLGIGGGDSDAPRAEYSTGVSNGAAYQGPQSNNLLQADAGAVGRGTGEAVHAHHAPPIEAYGQPRNESQVLVALDGTGAPVPYGVNPGQQGQLVPVEGGVGTGGGAEMGGYAPMGGATGDLIPYGGGAGAESSGGGRDNSVPGVYGDASGFPGANGSGYPGNAGDGAQAMGIPPSMAGQVKSWFDSLLVNPKGVLFEGGPLKVGVVHEYRMSQGRMVLHYMNLSSGPITQFSVDIPQVPFLRAKLGDVATVLDHGGRSQQVYMCECLQSFTESPSLVVSFASEGRRYSLALRLPIVVSSFMEPSQFDAMDFAQRWDMLAGSPREQSCELRTEQLVTAERWEGLRSMIASGLKMGLVEGVPGVANGVPHLHAAGTFKTGSFNPDGVKISLGVMLRVEVEPSSGTFRVTVRAVHGVVATALRDILSAQLGFSSGRP